MEKEKILDGEYTKLAVGKKTLQLLRELAFWSLFLSNIGIILLVGFVLNVLAEQLFSFRLASFFHDQQVSGWMMWLPIILFILPLFYLRSFSVRLKQAVQSKSQNLLDSALLQLKNGYKYLGYTVIGILSIWVISYLFF